MRNIMARVPHREKKRFAERLKQIWLQPDKESALKVAAIFCKDYEKRFPEAIRCLEENLFHQGLTDKVILNTPRSPAG